MGTFQVKLFQGFNVNSISAQYCASLWYKIQSMGAAWISEAEKIQNMSLFSTVV